MSPEPTLDFRNTNTLWCSVLVETLARRGVKYAVISPGSRSTSLTIALVAHPVIQAIPILDERSAAFFALGLAKRTRLPTVLVCSSGTAGANYFPAIIEASESGVPLLILTADRPPEMRECSSGQTIDQQKLFGSFVTFYHELAVPEPRLELLRYLRQTVSHAFDRSLQPVPGPVHLNAPFRDPLAPIEDNSAQPLQEKIDGSFFEHLSGELKTSTGITAWQRPTTARGLIVAGPSTAENPVAYAEVVRKLSKGLNWPVLADALSGVRSCVPDESTFVSTYDVILRNEAVARDLTPRFALCLGGWPTSKTLRRWLERSGAEILLITTHDDNRDGLHGKTRTLRLSVESLAVSGSPVADNSYRDAWSKLDTVARTELGATLEQHTTLFEGRAAWLLGRHLPPGTPIFVANSMPIRDVESFWPVNDRRFPIYFSRGANGIDGTLSTALGLAHDGKPSVLLTGDLALLHDTNGFLTAASKFCGSLTIVLINNAGGGIFNHLPVAQFDPPFEEYFATPQNIDFAKLCSAYGVQHVSVDNWGSFTNLIATLPEQGVRVLEIRTDRKSDASVRKKLFAGIAAKLG